MIRLSPFYLYVGALVVGILMRTALIVLDHAYFADASLWNLTRGLTLGIIFDSIFLASVFFITQTTSELVRFTKRQKSAHKALNAVIYSSLSLFVVCGMFDILFFHFLKTKIRIPLILNNLDQLGPIAGTLQASLNLTHYLLIIAIVVALALLLKSLPTSPLRLVLIQPSPSRSKRLTGIAFFFAASFIWLEEPLWRTEVVTKQPDIAMTIGNSGLYTAGMDATILTLNKNKTARLMDPSKASDLFENYFTHKTALSQATPSRKATLQAPKKQNVVIILMEYMGAFLSKRLTPNGPGVTPNLDKIASESISFTLGFASSTRTNHGFVSTLSGFPSILDTSIIRARNGRKIPTIATALAEYESTFLYSGDIGFDHMNAFATQGNFKYLVGDKELLDQNPDWAGKRSQWGYPDKLFLQYLNRYLATSYERGVPFFSFALTTSNHEPFQLPEDFYTSHPELKRNSVEAAAAYADSAIGDFFEKAKKEAYYQDTIFVFVADHSRIQSSQDALLKGFHIPIIIHSPRLKSQTQEITEAAKQVDIPATILGLLGRSFTDFTRFGHDLLAGDDPKSFFGVSRDGTNYIFSETGRAVRLNLVSGLPQFLEFDQYANARAVEKIEPIDGLDSKLFLDKSKAYLQTASDVLFGVRQ